MVFWYCPDNVQIFFSSQKCRDGVMGGGGQARLGCIVCSWTRPVHHRPVRKDAKPTAKLFLEKEKKTKKKRSRSWNWQGWTWWKTIKMTNFLVLHQHTLRTEFLPFLPNGDTDIFPCKLHPMTRKFKCVICHRWGLTSPFLISQNWRNTFGVD